MRISENMTDVVRSSSVAVCVNKGEKQAGKLERAFLTLLYPNKHLYFFDDSRFGTHSNLGHGWFEKGSRTPAKIKLGFQNFCHGNIQHSRSNYQL